MKYTTPIATGSYLTFKADTIRHAAETDTVDANFLTGAVTVETDTSGEVPAPHHICVYKF